MSSLIGDGDKLVANISSRRVNMQPAIIETVDRQCGLADIARTAVSSVDLTI